MVAVDTGVQDADPDLVASLERSGLERVDHLVAPQQAVERVGALGSGRDLVEPFARLLSKTCSFSTGSGLTFRSVGARPTVRSAAAPLTPAMPRALAANFASVDVTVTRPIAEFFAVTLAPAAASLLARASAETPLFASTWKVLVWLVAAVATPVRAAGVPAFAAVAPSAVVARATTPVTASMRIVAFIYSFVGNEPEGPKPIRPP